MAMKAIKDADCEISSLEIDQAGNITINTRRAGIEQRSDLDIWLKNHAG